MRVLLTLVTSSSGLSGVQRHALNLAACLLERQDVDVELVIAPWQRNLVRGYISDNARLHVRVANVPASAISRNAWFYYAFPRLANELGADLVHASYPIPLKAGAFSVPFVVTLHDLYPFEVPQNFGRYKAALHRSILRQCLTRADVVTCVSQSTANSALRYLPSAISAKMAVIHNCVQRRDVGAAAPKNLAARSSFILSIAQHRHNKNIPLLLGVLRRLLCERMVSPDTSLVIVGMRGPETPRIHNLIRNFGLTDKVVLLDGISEENLQWCYEKCSALVLSSTTEGFCLPVAEALLAGCPVICSDIPVLREIGGDRCTFVPLGPESELRFSQAIVASLRLPRPTPVDLPQFSTRRIGDQYCSLYRHLVGASSEPIREHLPGIATVTTAGGRQ